MSSTTSGRTATAAPGPAAAPRPPPSATGRVAFDRLDVDPVPAPADPVAAQAERELPLDVRRDHRARLELVLAEAAERVAAGGQAGLLVVAGEEPLARAGRLERGGERLLGHDLALRVAAMELLDRRVHGRPVHERVVGSHRDPQHVPVAVLRGTREIGIDGPEAEHQWLRYRRAAPSLGGTTAANAASRWSGAGTAAPAPGAIAIDGWSSASRTNGDTRRRARPTVVARVAQDELVARAGHRDVEQPALLLELDLALERDRVEQLSGTGSGSRRPAVGNRPATRPAGRPSGTRGPWPCGP